MASFFPLDTVAAFRGKAHKSRSTPLKRKVRRQRRFERLEDRTLLSVSPGEVNGISGTDFGSIVPIVNQTGHISLSIDGQGTLFDTGFMLVNKPVGATVRSAYLAAASTGGTGRILNNTDVRIDNSFVTWSVSTPSSIFSWNHWADVTSLVKSKIDNHPPGLINFLVTEIGSAGIDGEVLAVIFDDPNQTTNNTVTLLFGAQAVGGDTFTISLANPIDKSDPNLALDMSLGISFGFQPSGQFSQVDVNGTRMTTSAGGQDDGRVAAAGALLTVGGIGDSNNNPSNPFANADTPRSDDELYSLLPFVNDGDTSITVFTQNPSNDDNIFFAALNLRSTTAIVGEGIVLGPTDAQLETGQTHTVTATVQNDNGSPVVNRAVTFLITSGPNTGQTSTATTDSDGRATFSYTSGVAGNDQIEARFTDSQGQSHVSNRVVVRWVSSNRPPSASIGGPYEVDEGGIVVLTALGQDPDGDALTFAWDLDNNGTFETSGQSATFSALTLDGPTAATVAVRVDDEHGHQVVASGSITVNNVDPTATIIGAPSASPEGAAINLGSTVSDPSTADTHTHAWSVTKDGAPYTSGSDTDFAFTPNDNGAYVVTLTVTDDDGGVGTDTETIMVTNVDPVITGFSNSSPNPCGAAEGEAITVSGAFSDVGTADTHTATIDWGDGTTSAATIAEAGGSGSIAGSHIYADGGIYTITITLLDDDGGTDTATTQSAIVGAGIVGDVLYVIGTEGDDHVQVSAETGAYKVHADYFAGTSYKAFPAAGVQEIVVLLCHGNDHATISGGIGLRTTIDGGDGDDRIKGGSGHDVIFGGTGNDMLVGSSGRDLLVGGLGEDRIVGNADDDIIIGGQLNYALTDPQIDAIMAEWTSAKSYDIRTTTLETTLLTTTGANPTVQDDSAYDVVTGSGGQDWFFVEDESSNTTVRDKITDLSAAEFADALDFVFAEF